MRAVCYKFCSIFIAIVIMKDESQTGPRTAHALVVVELRTIVTPFLTSTARRKAIEEEVSSQ
jgi:hypothetical protein